MTAPDIKTPLPGPRAADLIARDARHVSPSYTRGYPLVMAGGQGAVVEDVDGNRFLDCAAGIAVNATGHSHPEVVKAIVDQAQRFLHMSGTDFYYEPQVRLAEEMSSIAPMDGPVRSFFGNSGTEAVEASLKLAKWYTKRHNVIAFLGSFHGRTMGSLSLTSSKGLQRKGFGPMVPGVYHAPYANCYRCPVNLRPETCCGECVDVIEQQILVHLVSPDEVAAIVVEPIQGEGGYVVPPAGVPRAAPCAGDHARHAARGRRSAVGDGPHGEDVRDGALRRAAGHRRVREGDCVGHAARRLRRARGGDVVAARRAREHVRRQPGVVRRRDCHDRPAEARADAERGGCRRLPARGAARADGQARRSSATCAARA